jgi:hypothetical protein
MSKQMPPKPLKLETEPLWKEACSLAEYMYGKLAEFPEEEKWQSENKLRTEANNLLYFISQGLGNASPSNREYEWGLARRSISALKTIYRFATRQKFIELEPEIMVRLDGLLKLIDVEVAKAYADTEAYNKQDMADWRKKYELAKKARS